MKVWPKFSEHPPHEHQQQQSRAADWRSRVSEAAAASVGSDSDGRGGQYIYNATLLCPNHHTDHNQQTGYSLHGLNYAVFVMASADDIGPHFALLK